MKAKFMLILSVLHAIALSIFIALSPSNTVPVHFDFNWQADRMGSKWTYLIFALLPLILIYLFKFYDKKYPKTQSMQQNRKYEHRFVPLLSLLFILLGWIMTPIALSQENLQLSGSFAGILMLCLGLLFFYAATFMAKIKKNHMFGLRVPWTLRSEVVWRKTHRMLGYTASIGSLLAIIFAIIAIVTQQSLYAALGLCGILLGGVIIPTIYSIILAKRQHI